MELVAKKQGDLLLVKVLDDRVDAACAIQFKEKMRDLATRAPRRVVLDMSRVTFLDSSGLGAVVAVMKLLGPEHQLELAALTPTVEKVFRLTRMVSVFVIHASLPDGLRDAG